MATAGYSLTELLVSMAVLTIVMGSTLAGLADVMKGNEMVMTISSMNNALRAGMDIMVRDMLQAASGLPSSKTVLIPSGGGSARVRLPGPPGTNFQTAAGDAFLSAVIPWNGGGPVINGVATDVVTILTADNAFLEVGLTAVANSQVTVAAGPNLGAGPDRVLAGQLMMISKGSTNTLVQVTAVDAGARVLTFADGDSLRLNQAGAASGNLPALNATAPVNDASATRITRMRMLTYYIDNVTDPARPRLVRRINNGDPMTFNNTLGTAVAVDTWDMQFTYDISNGTNNPGGVEMSAADMGAGGACAPDPCATTQIRKINLTLTSRSPNQVSGQTRFMTNTLRSQVSLRAMAFVDRYLE
jgi:prepilin-type N-terminal cleavage/methylation domain-containing protein